MTARRPDAGLTLVELMVTIIVASLIASSTFVFFAGQQRIYETQTKLLNVQQNLWAGMETLARYVRSAGNGLQGCIVDGVPPGGQTAPLAGIRAWNEDLGVIRMAPLWIKNGLNGAPDELTLTFGVGASGAYYDAKLEKELPAHAPQVPMHLRPGESKAFKEGDFLVIFDTGLPPESGTSDRGCTMFQVTGVNANNDIVHRNPNSPWNPNASVKEMIPWPYPGAPKYTGSVRNMGTLTSMRFFIDSTGAPTVPPRLMIDNLMDKLPAQVLAEGIEDLQIAYACDILPAGSPDGVLSEGTDAASRNADEWVYNQTGDVEPAACARPTGVRITLIGRSLSADSSLMATANSTGTPSESLSFKPAAEDGVAGAPDTFRHRVLTTTVSPRNLQ